LERYVHSESVADGGITAMRASTTEDDRGMEYSKAKSASFWTLAYERVRKSSGSDGKISEARY
jgi:hypothetical protein